MALYRIQPEFDGTLDPPVILDVDYGDLAAPMNSALTYVHDIFEHLIPGFGFNAPDEVRAFGAMVYCRRAPEAWLEQHFDPECLAILDGWPHHWGRLLSSILPTSPLQVADLARQTTPRPLDPESEGMLCQIADSFTKSRHVVDPQDLCLHLLRDGFRRARRVYSRTPRYAIASGMGAVYAALSDAVDYGRDWSATIRVSASDAGRPRVQLGQ